MKSFELPVCPACKNAPMVELATIDLTIRRACVNCKGVYVLSRMQMLLGNNAWQYVGQFTDREDSEYAPLKPKLRKLNL